MSEIRKKEKQLTEHPLQMAALYVWYWHTDVYKQSSLAHDQPLSAKLPVIYESHLAAAA